jgi:phosphoribosylglycinamide formyltransferase 1
MSPESSTASFISPDLPLIAQTSYPLLKLGVLASGNGTNFEALIQSIVDRQLHAEIPVVIYNNPGAAVAARAQRWGIPPLLVNHRDYHSREAFDFQVVQTLRQYNVDWVIMAGWMRKATEVLVDAFPDRIINIHPSLLPSFPGIHAVEQALKAGVKVAGCTVHLVCLEVDSGPILMQAAVPILPDDTAQTLHDRIQIQEHKILPRAIALAATLDRSRTI